MHVGVFVIQSASFRPIQLICCCPSLSTSFALSQSMTWFSPRHGLWWLTCELHCSPLPWRLVPVKESTSFLHSLILRPNYLPVYAMYKLQQFFSTHTIDQFGLLFILEVAFGWTTKFRNVRWGWLAVAMPWDFRILANVSLSPFTYSTTTIPLCLCDVYVGGKVRVSEFMIFLDLRHCGSKWNFVL